MSSIQIYPFSDKNILVIGDYETYYKQMKQFNARWNSRLKDGPGWTVPIEYEEAVRNHFNVYEDDDMEKNHKYRSSPKSKYSRGQKDLLNRYRVFEDTHEEVSSIPEEEEVVDVSSHRSRTNLSRDDYAPRRRYEDVMKPSEEKESVRRSDSHVLGASEHRSSDVRSTVNRRESSRTTEVRKTESKKSDEDIVSLVRKMKDLINKIETIQK